MNKKPNTKKPKPFVIGYEELGTIPIKELRDALIEDMHSIREIYNIQYVTSGRLIIPVTNEYGEAIRVRRPTGGFIDYIDTHHFRPACRDYDL